MKVVDALATWREQYGRVGADRRGPVFWVRLGSVSIPVPHPGQLHWHDLHHLVLGYGTDLVGEMEISAFELRTLPRTVIVFLLCVAGVAAGLIWAPRRTIAAWRRAKGWRNLYGSGLKYGDVIEGPMETLTAWMSPASQEPRASGSTRRRC
jgi:hypothetical protein